MDYLWKNCGETNNTLQIQQETAEFIRIKEEELKAISEHFQNLNKMEINKIEETIQNNSLKNPGQRSTGNRGPSRTSNTSVNNGGKRT